MGIGVAIGVTAAALVGGATASAISIREERRAAGRASRERVRQAGEILQTAEEEVELERQRTARLLGEARHEFAARGLQLTGSPFLFLRSMEEESEEAIELLRARAGRASAAAFQEARDIRRGARRGEIAGYISLGSSIFGGFSSILAKRAPAGSAPTGGGG